jgi:opacity protein-like surface antigen
MIFRLLLAATLGGLALATPAEADFFVEGDVGMAIMNDIDTKTYTFAVPPDSFTGHATLKYNDTFTAGVEIGSAGVERGYWRWSASYDYLNAKLHSFGVSGTINGTPGSASVPSDVVRAAGFDFDNQVHLAALNLYYNPAPLKRFQPYVGIGGGAAFIEHTDTKPALTATLGVRTPLPENFYAGLRYRYVHVFGPKDDLGIEYDDIGAHLFSLQFGRYF